MISVAHSTNNNFRVSASHEYLDIPPGHFSPDFPPEKNANNVEAWQTEHYEVEAGLAKEFC